MSSVITSVTFDKTVYSPGETITMTVVGTWDEIDTITVTTPDGATGTGTLTVTEPLRVTDSASRIWTLQSNNGNTAAFTTTA